jgi:hypothetical protein
MVMGRSRGWNWFSRFEIKAGNSPAYFLISLGIQLLLENILVGTVKWLVVLGLERCFQAAF